MLYVGCPLPHSWNVLGVWGVPEGQMILIGQGQHGVPCLLPRVQAAGEGLSGVQEIRVSGVLGDGVLGMLSV